MLVCIPLCAGLSDPRVRPVGHALTAILIKTDDRPDRLCSRARLYSVAHLDHEELIYRIDSRAVETGSALLLEVSRPRVVEVRTCLVEATFDRVSFEASLTRTNRQSVEPLRAFGLASR